MFKKINENTVKIINIHISGFVFQWLEFHCLNECRDIQAPKTPTGQFSSLKQNYKTLNKYKFIIKLNATIVLKQEALVFEWQLKNWHKCFLISSQICYIF